MNDKYEIQMIDWKDENLDRISKFTTDIWVNQGLDRTYDRTKNWFENQSFDIQPVSISVLDKNELVGWLLLVKHNEHEAEINPWALGGHPLINTMGDKDVIARLLIREVISLIKNESITSVELNHYTLGTEEEKIFHNVYTNLEFILLEQTCHMKMEFKTSDEFTYNLPKNYKIIPIKDVNESDFFSCFHNAFRNSQDPWMLEKSDDEIRSYFDSTIIKSPFPLIDNASIGLFENNKMIAFTVVRESHGEENGHLWIMGVHSDYRRQGLGNALMNLIKSKLKVSNYQTFSLNVNLVNTLAFQLYKKHNMKEDWVQNCYAWKKKE
ncbi:MAG: GNAT family N-acetyltransferase [Asgard group archaeon]|nr:GNAT family N-acetyltransferase [Asgard group archaeon]